MDNNVKLYNALFPIWMLIMFPLTWLYILPANFIIDSIVILITLKVLKCGSIKNIYKSTIIKVWIFGFASDFICGILLFLSQFIKGNWWYEYIMIPLVENPLDNWFALIYCLVTLFIAGFFIYFFNYKISFKKLNLPKKTIQKIALSLAIFTTPYVILFPSYTLYGYNVKVSFFTNHIVKYTQESYSISKSGKPIEVASDYGLNKWDLCYAINRADRYKKSDALFETPCEFKIIYFENEDTEDTRTEIDLWKKDQDCIFKHKNKTYIMKDYDSKEILDMLNGL
ncbi:MAG: hypothetical protein E6929_11840 [Clostridium sp.]|nr:hypothetical protein [Clostridium sp.]